ncbi:hypothetical protein, partial [Escherichia coli]|uniref:hypothetical protein n=1 Tax=Escherichia coli TaxID=562 RepID=UPI00372D4105
YIRRAFTFNSRELTNQDRKAGRNPSKTKKTIFILKINKLNNENYPPHRFSPHQKEFFLI